jgi:arylsulfatase A-like enzyme
VRAHPIVGAGLLLVAFRIGGLAVRYAVQSSGSAASRLALLVPSAMTNAGVLIAIVALFLLAADWIPRWRGTVTAVAGAVFAILMIAGLADLIVSMITGAPLTPTVFRTYRGLRVVRSREFLDPLRANAAAMLAGAGVFGGIVTWMVRLGRRYADRSTGEVHRWRAPSLVVFGVALAWLPTRAPWPLPPPPIEWAFVREWLGLDRTTIRGSEADAVARLREAVGLPHGAEWLTADYPLAYRWRDEAAPVERRSAPPDIVVVMVESLRAEELALTTGDSSGASVSPNLDALATRSVVFPTFISNGFPSAPSVFSFHASAWPHRRKEIITDFVDRGFDSIPARLRTLGYDTVYVGADPHFDHQSQWLSRWYATTVDLVASGIVATDRAIVQHGIDEIRRHDARGDRRPLFAFVSTYSTHYPFRLPDDAGEAPVGTAHGLAPQYRQTLRYTDRQIGDLLSFLQTRERRDRTVLLILGDHSFYTDLGRTSGIPENDNVWTAAIVNGPADLVGEPRRIVEPASHVDMLPTVLALVGDRRPSAALGSDLFGESRLAARRALAVRPGGWRLDVGGDSFIVDARLPNVAARRIAFPILAAPDHKATGVEVSVGELTDLVDAWSYLIERNRVWNDSLRSR